jgi:hypothetical protein
MILFLAACGGDAPPPPSQPALPDTCWLASAPAAPLPVADLRASAPTADVAVHGRVKDFVSGLASFTIVDPRVPSCRERPGDTCPTPWDYCCEDSKDLATKSAIVEFRDGDQPRRATMKGFHGLDHLSHVIVTGRAERDAQGNLTIVATGLHVKS